jgi:hypothetical protein
MSLFATSSQEFSGFMTALRFPPDYLELVEVEEHTRPGIVEMDNDSGGVGLLMANSRRRVGQEEERVHLATFHFNVTEAASDVGEVDIRFEPFENFFDWVAIHHRQGISDGSLPITAEVTPLQVTNTLLNIQAQPTRLGDVNLDYELTLTDVVNLVETLFKGEESVICSAAADFNADAQVDISDAIAILNRLFHGAPEPSGDIFCNAPS